MLNEEQFNGKWNEIKGGIRNLWGKITDDELEQIKGNITEVTGLVEEKYGETKEDIKQKLSRLMESFDNDTDKNISPDKSSFARSPVDNMASEARTTEISQRQDSDINTRSPERAAFDEKTFEASQEGESNYSGANPGRSGFGPERQRKTNTDNFDADRNARH
jgi:uncharacterized protein YjbJ (UPF0337 family)